jgi:predicted lysophospholipase L1 biosynthesis ABC-type transport system permease subunit
VFIPASFLPMDVPESHVVKPGEFSFVIGDARNITAFLDGYSSYIEDDLGLGFRFSDGGWLAVEKQISRADALGVVRMVLLGFAVLAGICLTVYLFIGRKRKEYAIMRALGTPRRNSGRSLYVPLGAIAAAAFAVGNILAYMLVGGIVESALSAYAELGIEASSAVPPSLAAACVLIEIAALFIVVAAGLRLIGRKTVLELLQTGSNRRAAAKAAPAR